MRVGQLSETATPNPASLHRRYAVTPRSPVTSTISLYGRTMEQREKLLRRVALKCADFARQLSYHKALADHVHGCRQNFWIYMFNNAIDLTVLDWFHLFGNHNDDLHWKRVVPDVDGFRQSLLRNIYMTEDEWKTYRETIKVYRDKDVAHIEVRPVSNVPKMQCALSATAFYYSVVLQELAGFRDYSRWPQALEEYHNRSLDQSYDFSALAFKSTQNISERVY